jgi:hypothetical protein
VQRLDAEFLRKVAFGIHLAYRVSHEVAPWLLVGLCNRKYAKAATSLLI